MHACLLVLACACLCLLGSAAVQRRVRTLNASLCTQPASHTTPPSSSSAQAHFSLFPGPIVYHIHRVRFRRRRCRYTPPSAPHSPVHTRLDGWQTSTLCIFIRCWAAGGFLISHNVLVSMHERYAAAALPLPNALRCHAKRSFPLASRRRLQAKASRTKPRQAHTSRARLAVS